MTMWFSFKFVVRQKVGNRLRWALGSNEPATPTTNPGTDSAGEANRDPKALKLAC